MLYLKLLESYIYIYIHIYIYIIPYIVCRRRLLNKPPGQRPNGMPDTGHDAVVLTINQFLGYAAVVMMVMVMTVMITMVMIMVIMVMMLMMLMVMLQ